MTLNTSIAIGAATNVHEVFQFCRELLGTPPETPFEHEDSGSRRPGQRQILNPGGIGLPAWLWIDYGVDGPLVHQHDKWCATEVGPAKWDDEGEYFVTSEDIEAHEREIEADPTMNGWAAIEVTFDTAYGYRSEHGESCSQLHARLVAQLGSWLDGKRLPWKWQNEYTGEWFDGYDGLAEFAGYHESSGADAWFRNVALPAILLRAGGAQ